MSRIEKGGAKFKPVARPVARPRPSLPSAASSQAASSSQTGAAPPPSSQAAPPSAPPSSFSKPPGLYGASAPPPPPSSSSTSTSTAAAGPSQPNASTSSEHAIPIPPARQYNPYLHDAAPPPIIIQPSRSSTAGPAVVGSARQEGGRAAPTIASTAAPTTSGSDRRAGSSVPTIATTSGRLPPTPVSRARAAPSIASTSGPVPSASSTSTPAAFNPAPRPGAAARAPTIAATTSTSSSSMAPPPPRPIASSSSSSRPTTTGRAPTLATTRDSSPPPPPSQPSQPSAPIASARDDSPPPPIVPRGRGILPPSRPIIAPPVSSARGSPSPPPPSSLPTQPGMASLPLGSRTVPRGLPPPVPEAGPSKGRKRGAPAATTTSPAKKAKGRPKKKTAEEAEAEADAEEFGVETGAAVEDGGSNENANGNEDEEAAAVPAGPKGKKPYVRTRPTPKISVKRKARMVVDSDDENNEPVEGEASSSRKKGKGKAPLNEDGTYGSGGDESPDETIQLKPKRKYAKKVVDPNAPPKVPRKKVERDADGNALSKYTRAPRAPRAPKEVVLGPDGQPLPPPKRKRKPRPPTGNPIGRPRKPVETIPDIDDVEAHNLLAGDGPDVLTTTMKEICEDTGMGRISSRFVEIQRKALDLKEARRAARDRMKARLKKAKDPGANDSEDEEGPLTVLEGGNAPEGVYVRPQHAAGSAAALDALAAQVKEAKRLANEAAGIENPVEDEEDDENDIDGVAEGGYAPQFRLVNGEMVLDQESLVADRHAETEARGEEEMDVVEERDTDRFVNSTTWGKKLRGERWSKEETDLFFTAINQFGTDFEMIARLFPGRTRKMIKNKWNREESSNATRVTEALLMKVPVDVATYSRMTQTDLSGPPPEILAPAPPPPTTPRNASAGPSKPTKKKRPNLRDGEEIVGQTGADGEEIRFDASDEEAAGMVSESGSRGGGRAVSTTSSVGAKSNASNVGGGSGGGGERPRSVSVAAVGAGVVGRKAPSVGAAPVAAEKGKGKEAAGPSGEMSDDEDLPAVGAIGR